MANVPDVKLVHIPTLVYMGLGFALLLIVYHFVFVRGR